MWFESLSFFFGILFAAKIHSIWHYWKEPDAKNKVLIRLGSNPEEAFAWSRTRMGGWAVAQSPILRATITLIRLQTRVYQNDISGKLNSDGIENLWIEMIRNPELLKMLEIEIVLHGYFIRSNH